MRKLLLLSTLSLTFLLLAVPALAQQPPDTINAALEDLSAQVGETVTFNDLDSWSFSGELFPDTSLGCAQPGRVYSPVMTSGVQFILEYEGVSYDYRVSADSRIVVLCGSTETTPPCPPPDDPAYLPPRLSVGSSARVVPTGIPNNIRQQPGSSSQLLGEIPPGAIFNVVGGPSCSTLDKIVWWRVEYNGLSGWTAEGRDQEYWLEPLNLTVTPTLPPPTPQPLTPANIAQASPLVELPNPNGQAVLSPDARYLAIIVNNGVQVVSLDTTMALATLTTGANNQPTSVAFDPRGRFVVAGDGQGTLRTWLIAADGTLSDGLQLVGHTGGVNALAVNPDGTLIASGSTTGAVYLWDAGTGALLNTLSNNIAPVVQVDFSQDGSALIASGGTNSNVVVWTIPTAAG